MTERKIIFGVVKDSDNVSFETIYTEFPSSMLGDGRRVSTGGYTIQSQSVTQVDEDDTYLIGDRAIPYLQRYGMFSELNVRLKYVRRFIADNITYGIARGASVELLSFRELASTRKRLSEIRLVGRGLI